MSKHIRGLCAFVTISAVLAALVSGCGLSTGANRTNASDGGGILTPAPTLIGIIQLPQASAASKGSIAVELRQADGTLVASTVTNASGCFSLRGGVDGRVEAHLPGGGTLAAEVRQSSPGYVYVNIPTTIISRYVRANPSVSLADAEARVKASLNIPARISLRGGLGDTWRSFFSPTAFAQAAGAASLDFAIDQAVARAANGGVRAFRISHTYPHLYRALHAREADLYEIGAAAAPAKTASASTDSSGSFFGNVCTGILKDGLSAGESAATGWACQKLGINQSASSQQQEYNTINTELTNLGNQVSALSVQISLAAGYSACNNAVADIQPCSQNFNKYIQLNDPQAAAQALIGYVGTNQFGADMLTLTDNLQGNTSKLLTPMVCNYAAKVDNASFGSTSPSGAWMWMDVRNNAQLDVVGQVADNYLGWMLVGACLQSEYAHLDPYNFPALLPQPPTTNQVFANITVAQEDIVGWAATIQNVQQLNAQPTIGGSSGAVENVIVFNDAGFMLCTDIQPPCGIHDYLVNAGNFSLGPWNDGYWEAASLCQLQALRGYAFNLGKGDVNKGLSMMGIGSDTTADIVFWTGGDCGESYSITRYNITKDTTEKETKGNYEYLVVRGLPGPNEALASLQAMAYPTSLNPPIASSTLVDNVTFPLLSTFGVSPPISYLYDYLYPYDSPPPLPDQNLTPYVTYTSSNPAAFTIANYGPSNANPAGWWGSVIFHTNAPSGTATASLCTSLSGTAGNPGDGERYLKTATLNASFFGPASTPQLTSIVVSPNQVRYNDNNLNNANNVEVSCFATGFYSDGTVKDLTNQVTWSVTNTSGGGTPTFVSANLLKLVQAEGTDTVTITATYTGSDPVAAGASPASGTVTTLF